MSTNQVELNRRNIGALAESDIDQNKRLANLETQIQAQALALQTLGNQLRAAQQSMAQAAATMGSGPTAR